MYAVFFRLHTAEGIAFGETLVLDFKVQAKPDQKLVFSQMMMDKIDKEDLNESVVISDVPSNEKIRHCAEPKDDTILLGKNSEVFCSNSPKVLAPLYEEKDKSMVDSYMKQSELGKSYF